MLYNTPHKTEKGDCRCAAGSEMPQCDLHEPFIGLQLKTKAPEIQYD